MFYEPKDFPLTRILEQNWQPLLAEYQAIRSRLTAWPEVHNYEGEWMTYPVFGFPHGEEIPERMRSCPLTAELVAEHAPRHGVAGFSVLRSGTTIWPHRGYQGDFLRCHLALDVPDGDCALSVEGDTRHWQQGKALVFDDRVLHEAWNRTQHERVVLLVDFVDPR